MTDLACSRRRFLTGVSVVGGVVAVGGLSAISLSRGYAPDAAVLSPAELDHALFAPAIGDAIRIGSADALVADVTTESSWANADGVSGTTFSVTLESPVAFPQGTHDVHHGSVGTFPLFLVPVGLPAEGRHTYEAVFNRIDGA